MQKRLLYIYPPVKGAILYQEIQSSTRAMMAETRRLEHLRISHSSSFGMTIKENIHSVGRSGIARLVKLSSEI